MTETWRKSSYSNPNGACVEVGTLGSLAAVRDTTQAGQPGRTTIEFSVGAWEKFLTAVR